MDDESEFLPKIAITTTSFGKYCKEPLRLLEKKGLEIIFNPFQRKLKSSEVVELCKNAIGVIAGTEKLDAATLEKLNKLKVISRCGAGIDNVDIDAAAKLNIKVYNTPDAPTLAVVELTMGLILNLLRKIEQMNTAIKNGRWEKLMGNLLYGKEVGIIGFGRIGSMLAELLMLFGCGVRYYDIRTGGEGLRTKGKVSRTQSSLLSSQYFQLDELLKDSDIISIHISSKEQIIGKNEIKQMKKGAWLVNVSRGGVVDEEALYQALKRGHLSGAALDVFAQEPYTGPLKDLDNVILTPHIGSYAKEARVKMEMETVENLLKGLEAT